MGKYNSSRCRVAPVFDRLYSADPTGADWLDGLIALASRKEVVQSAPQGLRLVQDHQKRWGKSEACLPAPATLLEYLVRQVTLDQVQKSGSKGHALERRTALANGDKDALTDALAQLTARKRGRHWFVLEGESRPDALLETDRAVICVEGKWRERACTTKTTWMPERSQLLRHMDAATDKFRGKQVLGLLMVEGTASDPNHPSKHWLDQCKQQYGSTLVAKSLPHRTNDEQKRIADGVLGVVTWQAVCERFGIAWPPAPADCVG